MGTEELEAQIKAASEKVVTLKGEKAEKPAIDAAVTSTPTQSNQYLRRILLVQVSRIAAASLKHADAPPL